MLKIILNIADDVKSGDILYINGAYTSLFKNKMILYEGKRGMKLKIGEYFFNFSEAINYSEQNFEEFINERRN